MPSISSRWLGWSKPHVRNQGLRFDLLFPHPQMHSMPYNANAKPMQLS